MSEPSRTARVGTNQNRASLENNQGGVDSVEALSFGIEAERNRRHVFEAGGDLARRQSRNDRRRNIHSAKNERAEGNHVCKCV